MSIGRTTYMTSTLLSYIKVCFMTDKYLYLGVIRKKIRSSLQVNLSRQNIISLEFN